MTHQSGHQFTPVWYTTTNEYHITYKWVIWYSLSVIGPWIIFQEFTNSQNTVGCVFPMISIKSRAEFGRNDHREDAPHFTKTLTSFEMRLNCKSKLGIEHASNSNDGHVKMTSLRIYLTVRDEKYENNLDIFEWRCCWWQFFNVGDRIYDILNFHMEWRHQHRCKVELGHMNQSNLRNLGRVRADFRGKWSADPWLTLLLEGKVYIENLGEETP